MKQPQNDTKQKDKHSISSAKQEGKKDNEEEEGLISRAYLACGVQARRGKSRKKIYLRPYQSIPVVPSESKSKPAGFN